MFPVRYESDFCILIQINSIFKSFQHSEPIQTLTKLCRQQAEVIQNHENEHVRGIGQGEARHRKYNSHQLRGGQAYDRSSV
jgi:hypothetical protein